MFLEVVVVYANGQIEDQFTENEIIWYYIANNWMLSIYYICTCTMNVPTYMLVRSQWWSAILNNVDSLLWQSPGIWCLYICYLKLSLHLYLYVVSLKTLFDVIFDDMIFLLPFLFWFSYWVTISGKVPSCYWIHPSSRKDIIGASMSPWYFVESKSIYCVWDS